MLMTRARRGNAAMEMALLLPVVLLLGLPVLDYCWYFVALQSVASAAQIGARIGAQAGPYDDPVALAEAAAMSALETSSPRLVDTAVVEGSLVDGDTIQLEVTADFVPLTNFISMASTLWARQRMLIERQFHATALP